MCFQIALLESLGDDSVVVSTLAILTTTLRGKVSKSCSCFQPLSVLWGALKALLLRTELAAEDLLAAKMAVEACETEEAVDVNEFVLELMALMEEGAP